MPPPARLLGAAGLLPQGAAALLVVAGPLEWRFTALALAFAYAALILSFLGGLWWGLAAAVRQVPDWIYWAAVVPSLFALVTCVPWSIGSDWPGPSLVALGLAILASLGVDLRLDRMGLAPRWWLGLRVPLSLGLGTLTLIVGLAA
ncbi:DUF3429 domain-containing protein [Sphingomonas spermidinifaciens]|uniref:DUF3429 domain-containing protein n=1 Tax=Sphingomonas spermidinifaciens TaxID=1141889 RepID=UPI001FEABE20|nr:DUF3429 domain-containing protein [Sphingomonas spermidinifaciens]